MEIMQTTLTHVAKGQSHPVFESITNPYVIVIFVLSIILYFLVFGFSRISFYILVFLASAIPYALGVTSVIPGKDATPTLAILFALAVAGTLYELWKKKK